MSKGKNVVAAENESKALVAPNSYGEDAGAGFDNLTSEDFSIPFVNILQKMSPVVDSDHASYIDGAKAGMLINSVTRIMYDGKVGVQFVPVHTTHSFIEWKSRKAGGGFVAEHDPDSDIVVKARKADPKGFGKLYLQPGNELSNELVETFSVYGILINDEGGYESVVLNFASSNIKQYKRWMTTARSIQLRDEDGHRFTPPLFSHIYRIRTQYQENAKGSWYSFMVALDAPRAEDCRLAQDDELYLAAKAFRSLVTSGAAKVQYNTPSTEAEKEEGEDTF